MEGSTPMRGVRHERRGAAFPRRPWLQSVVLPRFCDRLSLYLALISIVLSQQRGLEVLCSRGVVNTLREWGSKDGGKTSLCISSAHGRPPPLIHQTSLTKHKFKASGQEEQSHRLSTGPSEHAVAQILRLGQSGSDTSLRPPPICFPALRFCPFENAV